MWFEISFGPIRNGDEVIGTACHSRNITQKVKTEMQLSRSAAFNRGVIDSLRSHIAVIDASGEILAVNEAWQRFATENGEAPLRRAGTGGNYLKVCSQSAKSGDKIAAMVLQGIKNVIDKQKADFYLEYPCDSPDEQLWFGMRAVKFEFDDPMVVISHENISELKLAVIKGRRAETELTKMMNDLKVRNKDLEQFAYIISHNLRSPIANIIGASGILADPELSAEEKEVLGRGISTSINKLDDVVKDISHILEVKGAVIKEREIISLSGLVEDIKISIENLLNKHGVKIKYDFSAVGEILTLKPYLYSIFYNLISNSIKYCRQDIPCVILIKSSLKKNKMELTFTDNGIGINLEKNGGNVFGLYKRFHNHVEGKGMGLYMVKTQVEALGGKISIKSAENKGTEFKIEFEL